MVDLMVIGDVNSVSKKRKRAPVHTSPEQNEEKIHALREEMERLFRFYGEMLEKKGELVDNTVNGVSLESAIAALIEESRLPLSKLVELIFEKLKGSFVITIAVVKSKVILIGQRLQYGLPNVDADVLEDESHSALWCWETRDVKLMPKSTRNMLKIRRTCRKKIHERIMALSAMIDALQKSESHENSRQELMKASKNLCKLLNESDIRSLVESMTQKNDSEMAVKDTKNEEKTLIKQMEKNKREAEKEKKRMDQKLLKEKLESEKELKRLKDEAEKEEKRKEKEKLELSKQLQKSQEEAEKEQKRKEKEEAELKKQLRLQKQASLMERFLKGGKSGSDQSLKKVNLSESSFNKTENMHNSITQSMDSILSQKHQTNAENLWKSHVKNWRGLCPSRKHWGIRTKSKREVFIGLKLCTNKEATSDCDLIEDKLDHDMTQCHTNTNEKRIHFKQLLQFDKSCRPAFYGVWPKKSQAVGPRNPFRKDPDLDYEIDSDEEWEEEEPGESLSDCDKDDEADIMEEGSLRGEDENESEDEFFVPDGYLSENEGVEVEKMKTDDIIQDSKLNDEFSTLLGQQKYLSNLTEHALKKNQPLIILNLMHEKASLLLAEDLSGTDKIEKICLQALSIYTFPNSSSIEISLSDNCKKEDEQEVVNLIPTQSKSCTTPITTKSANEDLDLLQIISVIRSCSYGINKLVETLQQKFPNSPKSQLNKKVREIAEFSDNRWQVKKDILVKFGLPISPEVSGKTKSIVSFFSKRCLPPTGKTINFNESSPESSKKGVAVIQTQEKDYTNEKN